jgi:hypothetical protein
MNLGDAEVTLHMQGSDLFLETDDVVEMFCYLDILKAGKLISMRRLAEDFDRMGLTLSVVSRGKKVIVIGKKAKFSVTGRLLGVPHVELAGGTETARIFKALLKG